MRGDNVLCLDFGGTGLKSALIRDGALSERRSVPTDTSNGRAGLERTLRTAIAGYEIQELTAVAISSAGDIDSRAGTVAYATPNLPEYTGFHLADFVRNIVPKPCVCLNDGMAALLGEVGARKQNYDCVAMLTLGTGVGGALMRRGELLRDDRFRSPGHIVFEEDGLLCNCGKRGCIERYVSGTALGERVRREGISLASKEEIWQLYREGDARAAKAVLGWLKDLSAAIDRIYEIEQFDMMILGGGVADSGELWLPDLPRQARYRTELAVLGNNAGLLGAYEFWMQRKSEFGL